MNTKNLNPNFTFDTFVVSNNNQFAFCASKNAAEYPETIYNPLFLYGGTGLGKTHLMHAITHQIRQQHPEKKILYITASDFTNQIVEAIHPGTGSNTAALSRFRDKYRNIDVLLIDDFQFIIGKEATQEEFFYIFNTLYEEKKQIIISSDRPPKDMSHMDERYKSRLEWGLIACIQSPDYEAKVSILKRKLETHNQSVNEEIIEFIATHIKSDVRLLEGALNKVLSLSDIEKTTVNMDMAKEALIDLLPENKKIIDKKLFDKTVIKIIPCVVAAYYHSNIAELKTGHRYGDTPRSQSLFVGRIVEVMLFRKFSSLYYTNIAPLTGFSSGGMLARVMCELEMEGFIRKKCLTAYYQLSDIIIEIQNYLEDQDISWPGCNS